MYFSKGQATGQQRFKFSPQKGSSLKERQVSRNKVADTDFDFADQSSIERAVMHALHDVQSGVPGPEPEFSSLMTLPAPQRPPRPGTPPPPELSPQVINESFIPGLGPADLYVMPSGRIRGEDRMEPEKLEAVKNWRDQMLQGGARGEKRRDFDQRSPDFTKRHRAFSPDRGGYDDERGYGDMAIDFDQGQSFDQDQGFDQTRGFDQDRDFDQDHGRYDDNDWRRQPNSPDRARFDWDNDPSSPSYGDGRYGDDREWERRPRFDDRFEEESRFDNRFEPQQYGDRSPDRDSDNGYRYLVGIPTEV